MESTELRQRREELRLTQEELAIELGVKGNTVYRWESGRVPIPKTVALALEALEHRKKRNSDPTIVV